MNRALITGVTGQDGSYLADLLIEKGYVVYGLYRRSSSDNTERVKHLIGHPRFHLLVGSMADSSSLIKAVQDADPAEVYNLAAMSYVGSSWNLAVETANTNATGTTRLLEAIRLVNPQIRFYQASTSEMFGGKERSLFGSTLTQNEKTPFYPRSPYGVSKTYAHYITVNYRESYGMHASCGILFNHESERRGLEFFTRKVTDGIGQIAAGKKKDLQVGNLAFYRDWGYAPDYVEAMWRMLQQPTPDDYVIATGEAHSGQDFIDLAFELAGLDAEKYVWQDGDLYRPADVHTLMGDAAKAGSVLGWTPTTPFEEMVRRMVDHDLARHQEPKVWHGTEAELLDTRISG